MKDQAVIWYRDSENWLQRFHMFFLWGVCWFHIRKTTEYKPLQRQKSRIHRNPQHIEGKNKPGRETKPQRTFTCSCYYPESFGKVPRFYALSTALKVLIFFIRNILVISIHLNKTLCSLLPILETLEFLSDHTWYLNLLRFPCCKFSFDFFISPNILLALWRPL